MLEISLKDYVLFFLKDEKPYTHRIPGIHFWATTGLLIRAGVRIQASNGHYLNMEDCMNEIHDCLEGDCFKNGWVESWWKQRKKLFGGNPDDRM
jgi:hypothetical protein